MCVDGAGNVVVVWGDNGIDSPTSRIRARRFDNTGAAMSNDFVVCADTPGIRWMPSVACDAAGNFTVVWASQNQVSPTSGADVFARRFDSSGAPLGSEFQVNTYTA